MKTPFELHGAYLYDEHNEKVQLYGMSTHGMAWYPQYVCKETLQFLRDECCCIVKPDSTKLSGWTEEDLTDSGLKTRERFLSKAN